MESGSKALRAPDIVKSIRVIVSPLALQTHKFDPVIVHVHTESCALHNVDGGRGEDEKSVSCAIAFIARLTLG